MLCGNVTTFACDIYGKFYETLFHDFPHKEEEEEGEAVVIFRSIVSIHVFHFGFFLRVEHATDVRIFFQFREQVVKRGKFGQRLFHVLI